MEAPGLAKASKVGAEGASITSKSITSKSIPPDPIAIVGIGCRLPGSTNSAKAFWELLRDGRVVYESHLASLRRFKEDVREVKSGFECGTSLENFNDIKIGDVIEVYEHMEVSATL